MDTDKNLEQNLNELNVKSQYKYESNYKENVIDDNTIR